MATVTIELEASLWEKVQQLAAASGASPQAFLETLVKNHLGRPDSAEEDAAVTRKLEQLGYIDAGLDI